MGVYKYAFESIDQSFYDNINKSAVAVWDDKSIVSSFFILNYSRNF